ncbi:hypothetical protein [Marinobacter sp. SS21]|uniref:hypothetical protein n=1 Tax=Marinobacter sp. SS21 TaxID=2979460 RepID=UPI00232F4CB7|nr:hypothetical protein [Marinobacter sp. SS21]MDC0661540.1 hypothetical protein [Marinobacter sp. SS21]
MAGYYIKLVLVNTVALMALVAVTTALSHTLNVHVTGLPRVNAPGLNLTFPLPSAPDLYSHLLDSIRKP